MKYCLSINQTIQVLKKADEIKMLSKDWQYIEKLRLDFPETPIIFEVDKDFILENFLDHNYENIIYACDNIHQMTACKNRGVSFYYKYPVTSYYEARALKNLGVCYFLVGIPLFFDLENLSTLKVPLRAIPNLAYEPYLPHVNGINGSWIRPEDVDKYEKYISVLEFYNEEGRKEKEATLFKIYAEDKNWPGNLNLLIDYLNYDIDNRLIYNEDGFAERRMNCKQKCMTNYSSCHFCEDRMLFGEKIAKFAKETKRVNLT